LYEPFAFSTSVPQSKMGLFALHIQFDFLFTARRHDTLSSGWHEIVLEIAAGVLDFVSLS
jgi:hypothetical protein